VDLPVCDLFAERYRSCSRGLPRLQLAGRFVGKYPRDDLPANEVGIFEEALAETLHDRARQVIQPLTVALLLGKQ
jgi:hypothetical protein